MDGHRYTGMSHPIKNRKPLSVLVVLGLLLVLAACKKDQVNLDTECIEAKALGFGDYCENTFLMQLSAKYASLGKTIEFDGKTYHHVVKIAGGNITLYDGFHADDRVFLKLRKYNPQKDHELVISQHPCLAILGPQFPDVPIYVANAISSEHCP